jgi:hypothetical protein
LSSPSALAIAARRDGGFAGAVRRSRTSTVMTATPTTAKQKLTTKTVS